MFWFVSWNYNTLVSDSDPDQSGTETKQNKQKWRSTWQKKKNQSETKQNKVEEIE